uniref:Uncharacterized protein MANES_12G054100 n=1 Tax=Rhizophora mucronata TaxID=61149 RepID=A0A2P2INR2_RHIMU
MEACRRLPLRWLSPLSCLSWSWRLPKQATLCSSIRLRLVLWRLAVPLIPSVRPNRSSLMSSLLSSSLLGLPLSWLTSPRTLLK